MKCLVTALCIFLGTSASFAATYYVSPSGDDSANGTSPATAWATTRHVNDGTIRGGDAILFKAGGAWTTERVYATGGTSGSPTLFGSYSSGARPRLGHSLVLDHKSWVKVRGLELYNDADNVNALLIGDGTHNEVDDCYIYIPASNSRVYSAVSISGPFNKITNSTIEHLNTGMQNDAVAFRAGADYNTFENNTLRQATHYLLTLIATTAANPGATANHNIIRGNIFTNAHGGLIDMVSGARLQSP